jgi:hypothetical protein
MVLHSLSLAATPTFAFMALLTGVLDAGTPDVLCSGVQAASVLSGMGTMYLLMSAFHSGPWLKLICAAAPSRLCRR